MEIVKTEKQTKEVTVECYLICDKCGKRIKPKDRFDAFECEFIYKTGSSYPEGGSGNKLSLDLCQECGIKATKLFKDNGFKIQETKWDW